MWLIRMGEGNGNYDWGYKRPTARTGNENLADISVDVVLAVANPELI